MKYVFFGGQESEFAQIILDKLTDSGEKPVAAIRNSKLPLDPEYLKSLNADFFLVAAFAKILKKEIIDLPKKGTVGAHPSLLPKYRGASPVQSALLNNEKETGTTLFVIDEKVDHGPIIASSKLQIIHNDTYKSLIESLAKLSGNLILDVIPSWLTGEIQLQSQNEKEATYTKKFVTEDALIDLQKEDSEKKWLKIRALNPEPGTYSVLKLKSGKELRLKILKAAFTANRLEIEEVQPEGKKAMKFKDFLNGYAKNLNGTDLKNLS